VHESIHALRANKAEVIKAFWWRAVM